VRRAPMALMNMVSSNINQWTLLTAMLPVVYSMSRGSASSISFDNQQELELLMTLGQSLCGMVFLVNMELVWWEAAVLFVLWFTQFVFSGVPSSATGFLGFIGVHIHRGITATYFVWAAWEILRLFLGQRKPAAFTAFAAVWRKYVSS
jgi:hypothetical protein